MQTDPVGARVIRRFLLAALGLPALLVIIGVATQLRVLPDVPATVATHWNAAGEADGFAPAWMQPLATLAFGLGVPALIALTTLPGLRRSGGGPTYRLMGATAAATSALVVGAFTWTFVMQAGPEETPVWLIMLGCLAVALVVGLLAWLVQPRVAAADTAGDVPAAPLPLRRGERAVWLRTATMATGAIVGITLAVVAVCIAAILSWMADGGVAAVILSALAVVVLLLAVSSTAFRVRVDERGLRVASLLGVPRFQVPLTDVAAAARVTIEPMGEFGGWGMRVGPGGRFGVLLRRGEAIEVTRRSGTRFVVTVDDAGTGAALLEALRERQGTAAD